MADRVGQQLGNYRLTRLLGQGGFAEVYLGEHVYLKTPGAIKLLHTKGAYQKEEDSRSCAIMSFAGSWIVVAPFPGSSR